MVDARIEEAERERRDGEYELVTPVAKRMRVDVDEEDGGWDKLTSSVVKQRIVAGLLELKRGG